MESRPRILVTPLCGLERDGWLNPTLLMALLEMQRDLRFDLTIELALGMTPVDYARNQCVATARNRKFDWLLLIDNDQTIPSNVLNIIAEATPQIDVVGLPCGIGKNNGRSFQLNCDFIPGTTDGNFMGLAKMGSGVLLIRNTLWARLPKGPWFRTLHNDDELLSLKQGEDIFFCDLARAAGLKLWAHRMGSGHLKTADLTQFAVPRR